MRGFLGDPAGVHAKTIGHPKSTWRRRARGRFSTMARRVRCTLSVNHNHAFGRRHQVAEFRFDGTEGAAHATMGLLLDYPRGEPDALSIRPKGETEWFDVPLAGRLVPRRLRRPHGQSATLRGRRRRGARRRASKTRGRRWRSSRRPIDPARAGDRPFAASLTSARPQCPNRRSISRIMSSATSA